MVVMFKTYMYLSLAVLFIALHFTVQAAVPLYVLAKHMGW